MLHTLDFKDTFYVPSFSRNLVSVSKLASDSFHFMFEISIVELMKDSIVIVIDSTSDGLYKLCLSNEKEQSFDSLHTSVSIGNKRGRVNENSSILWHKRL